MPHSRSREECVWQLGGPLWSLSMPPSLPFNGKLIRTAAITQGGHSNQGLGPLGDKPSRAAEGQGLFC